jgi:hypothetical protein
VAGDLGCSDRLGDAYQQAGSGDKARACWQKALTLFPKTAEPGDRRKAALERKLKESQP